MRKTLIVFVAWLSASALCQTKPSTAAHHKTAAKKAAEAPAAQPTATIETTAGDLHCILFPDKAPNNVANFVGLATGTKQWHDPKTDKNVFHRPLYNGTIFHRVIPNFMIQGGDPLGTGTGGPGYEMNDEIVPDLKFDVPGRLALANSGPNTNGSQFFVTELPTPWLDGHYTIIGQCDQKSVDLVKDIARRARDERTDRPYDPVVIKRIVIEGYKKPVAVHKPAHKKPTSSKGSTNKASASH